MSRLREKTRNLEALYVLSYTNVSRLSLNVTSVCRVWSSASRAPCSGRTAILTIGIIDFVSRRISVKGWSRRTDAVFGVRAGAAGGGRRHKQWLLHGGGGGNGRWAVDASALADARNGARLTIGFIPI